MKFQKMRFKPCSAAQNLSHKFWMEVNLHCQFICDINLINIHHVTSVTIPSLFLSKAFMKKSEDFRILMKLSFVRFPSSPASRITLKWFIDLVDADLCEHDKSSFNKPYTDAALWCFKVGWDKNLDMGCEVQSIFKWC